MRHKAVIGLGFGDEGKGLVTSYLCSKSYNPLVIRFSGGHQAGHTVVNDTTRHVFSNLGSGTLQKVPTFWSKFCTVEPIGLCNELDILSRKMDIHDIDLFISPDSPITTPYDIRANIDHEIDHNHGSVGVGFGKTIERNEKLVTLTFSDLFHPQVFRIKLDMIARYYGHGKFDNWRFSAAIQQLLLHVDNGIIQMLGNFPKFNTKDYYDNIYEGSQGLLLDQNYGFFPHVTRSNVGSKRLNMLNTSDDIIDRYYVTRAYQTRHGDGPMSHETDNIYLINNEKETNVFNNYQGRLRIAPLDIDLLKYAINCDRKEIIKKGEEHLVITCMDQIDGKIKFYLEEKKYETELDEFVEKIGSALHFQPEKILVSFSEKSTLDESNQIF